MSVRLSYLERGRRGGQLRGIRLVGQGVLERWPGASTAAPDSLDAALPWINRGAEWLAERLAQSRAAGRLEAVVLDVDGATCTWVSASGTDIPAIAAAARLGGPGLDASPEMPGAEASAPTPVTYFAGDEIDSTIQPLGLPGEDEGIGTEGASGPTGDSGGGTALLARLRKPAAKAPAPTGRLGIVAACDVPARLLVDALDRRGVAVQRSITFWHALVQAWDPASPFARPRGASENVVTQSETVVAVLAVDLGDLDSETESPDAAPPRLIWAWSRGGTLLAGGSMRLAHTRKDNQDELLLGQGEASRLAAEWLAWSMQLGVTPGGVVCAFPEVCVDDGSAARFGSALSKAWDNVPVNAGSYTDPIAATLERLATALESTPARAGAAVRPGQALVELSNRPGGAHRTMYHWLSVVVLAASIVMGVVAWQARRSAERITEVSKVWSAKGTDAAKDALGMTSAMPLVDLRDEVSRRERDLTPPRRVVPAKPVLEELETISMVISQEELTLDSIDFSSANLARFSVTAKTIDPLERLAAAMRRISGSRVDEWTATFREINDPKGGKAVQASFSANWLPSPGEEGAGNP